MTGDCLDYYILCQLCVNSHNTGLINTYTQHWADPITIYYRNTATCHVRGVWCHEGVRLNQKQYIIKRGIGPNIYLYDEAYLVMWGQHFTKFGLHSAT